MKNKLYKFLNAVDKDFPINLSAKTDLDELSDKFIKNGVLCYKEENDILTALVAGYANDLETKTAYISVVATLNEHRGKGFAKELVKEFLKKAKENGMEKAVLYTHYTNKGAIMLYKNLGFAEIPSERNGDIKFEITF